MSTQTYANGIDAQRAALAANLTTMGVTSTATEALSALVPKVLDIVQGDDTSSGDAVAAEILSGKKAWVDGAEVTGTMPDNEGDNACSSSSVASTTLKLVAPTGFYDGTDTVTITDADFVAANIADGVDIFGVTGTLAAGTSNAHDSGLIGKWSFDNISGSTAYNDYTGTATRHDMTLSNVTATAALVNNGGSFNGTSSYASIASSDVFLRTTFSIVLWFKTSANTQSGSDNRRLAANANGGYQNLTCFMEFDGATQNNLIMGTYTDTWKSCVTTAGSYNNDAWHMVVGCVNLQELTISINMDNGAEIRSTALNIPTISTNNTNLYIGKAGSFNAGYYSGLIDCVRIYAKALSSTEIASLYNAGAGID